MPPHSRPSGHRCPQRLDGCGVWTVFLALLDMALLVPFVFLSSIHVSRAMLTKGGVAYISMLADVFSVKQTVSELSIES